MAAALEGRSKLAEGAQRAQSPEGETVILPLAGLDLRHEAGGWEFAEREGARIAAHWQALQARNPSLWNGEMLMGFDPAMAAGRLSLRLRTVSFSSFIAWRDWGFADPSAWNCFGTPVIASADGAILFGVMADHTLNAGLAYPPSGSLEPRDVRRDATVDIEGSMALELEEETGLDLAEGRMEGQWAVFEARRLSVARLVRFEMGAAALVARIEDHIGRQRQPELAGVVALRGPSDLARPMPPYARALAHHLLAL